MDISVINFGEKFEKINEQHSYKIIAQINDYHFKLVKHKENLYGISILKLTKFSW